MMMFQDLTEEHDKLSAKVSEVEHLQGKLQVKEESLQHLQVQLQDITTQRDVRRHACSLLY